MLQDSGLIPSKCINVASYLSSFIISLGVKWPALEVDNAANDHINIAWDCEMLLHVSLCCGA